MTRASTSWLAVSCFLFLAHCTTKQDAPAAPRTGDPAASLPRTGIRGQLFYEGKAYTLDRNLDIIAVRCREPEQTSIDVQIRIPAADSPYKNIPLKLLAISADPRKLPIGQRFTPQTLAQRYSPDPARDGQARVLGWLSPAGQIGQSGLPAKAWVRFDQISRTGPIDVSFDLDFGSLGRAEGRVLVAETQEEVCVIPSPPPPPPPR